MNIANGLLIVKDEIRVVVGKWHVNRHFEEIEETDLENEFNISPTEKSYSINSTSYQESII
jgi:hypothetical protein